MPDFTGVVVEQEPRFPVTDEERAAALARYRRRNPRMRPRGPRRGIVRRRRPARRGSIQEMIAADMWFAMDHHPAWCPICGHIHAPVDPCAPPPDPPVLRGLLNG